MANTINNSSCCVSTKSTYHIQNMEELMRQPLAFASANKDENLVAATSRLVYETEAKEFLNIEVFGGGQKTLLVVIPGICESAETLGVQAIVKAATDVTVAVIELPGHGLSSGPRCVIGDFEALVTTITGAIHYITQQLHPDQTFLTGNSLGGALVIYAAAHLDQLNVVGIAPIAPAVGVAPQAVPHWTIVGGLQALACIGPTWQIPNVTPFEDPSHYNCPSNTQRNFTGHWPLATCRMLLHVTAEGAPRDIKSGFLALKNIPHVLVIAGKRDQVVPLTFIEDFYQKVESPNKDIKILSQAGHDLLFQPKPSQQVTKELMEWIRACVHQ